MADGIAAIDRVPDAELASALAAVPGSVITGDRMAWGLRLGPDRAWSLASIADRMGLAFGTPDRHELDHLIERRDVHDPVVEITHDHDGCWLSLLDDWTLLVVSALRRIPGARERTAAGRTEVPFNRWTAETIRGWIDTHELRLSPAAELALRESLTPAVPRTAAVTVPAPSVGGAAIVMDESGANLILDACNRDDLVIPFASLPTAQSWVGVGRRWLLSPTPEAARAVREMLGTLEGISLDDATTRWLEEAPRWIARIDVDRSGGGAPRLEITTRWGEPPEAIERLTEPSGAGTRRKAALTPVNLRVVDDVLRSQREVTLGPAAADALEWLRSNPDATSIPAAELDVVEEHGFTRFVVEPVSDPDAEAAFVQQEEQLFRRHRQDHPGHPCLPADAWPPDELARLIRVRNLSCTAAARRLVESAMTTDEDAQRLLALSRAHDADVTVDGLARELMPFQRAGVAYALERRRVFLADEQGLGKTIQALATLQADAAFPAVVVCPASLKLNWLREARAWLPQRTARVVSGRAPVSFEDAEIVVLNYEIVGAHTDALDAHGPRALILDESHYVKSADTQRTRAVLDLAERLGPQALRLALTGTPVVNRPAELAPQLRILGRLAEYGSARSFQRGYATGSARRRLHERLRSSCYLRRRKQDVLEQLPAKRRAVVTVPLDNEGEYQRAERDFVRWLREEIEATGRGSLPESSRAAALVRLTALRRLAARGKLAAALAWIEDFAESGERLVVFAHHRDIQAEVVERFSASARILGSDTIDKREANVHRFQAPDGPQLCVCSLEAASHGFTLTAAANVAFLELAWTPAKHDQAEDRLHRIGQAQAVTAWYLLAAETIDERIARLLEDKRAVVGSLTDGGDDASASLVSALIGSYAG